ncbi:DUF397 domain-containing protein [Streptomyces paromomycinus]
MASPPTWLKSSYSNGSGGNCIETFSIPEDDITLVRDSKRLEGPILTFRTEAWCLFLDEVRGSGWA